MNSLKCFNMSLKLERNALCIVIEKKIQNTNFILNMAEKWTRARLWMIKLFANYSCNIEQRFFIRVFFEFDYVQKRKILLIE